MTGVPHAVPAQGGDRAAAVGTPLLAVLAKAGRENFPVALRVLPRARRGALLAVYAYARYVDDVGDEPEVPDAERVRRLDAVEADLDLVFSGRPARLPALAGLEPVVRAFGLPRRPFDDLVAANRTDLVVSRYDTWADLLGYCRLSANPVGRLVLTVFGAASAQRLPLSDDVCTALQVLEHLQDVGEDLGRGRIYLPRADLARHGVTEVDLAAPAASPGLRALVGELTGRARALLAAGPPLTASLTGTSRLALAGFVGGGLATADALDAAHGDVLGAAVSPGRAATVRRAVGVLRARTPR